MAVIWQVKPHTSHLTPHWGQLTVNTESRPGLMLLSRKTNKKLRQKKGGWEWGYKYNKPNYIRLHLCSRLHVLVWFRRRREAVADLVLGEVWGGGGQWSCCVSLAGDGQDKHLTWHVVTLYSGHHHPPPSNMLNSSSSNSSCHHIPWAYQSVSVTTLPVFLQFWWDQAIQPCSNNVVKQWKLLL